MSKFSRWAGSWNLWNLLREWKYVWADTGRVKHTVIQTHNHLNVIRIHKTQLSESQTVQRFRQWSWHTRVRLIDQSCSISGQYCVFSSRLAKLLWKSKQRWTEPLLAKLSVSNIHHSLKPDSTSTLTFCTYCRNKGHFCVLTFDNPSTCLIVWPLVFDVLAVSPC